MIQFVFRFLGIAQFAHLGRRANGICAEDTSHLKLVTGLDTVEFRAMALVDCVLWQRCAPTIHREYHLSSVNTKAQILMAKQDDQAEVVRSDQCSLRRYRVGD